MPLPTITFLKLSLCREHSCPDRHTTDTEYQAHGVCFVLFWTLLDVQVIRCTFFIFIVKISRCNLVYCIAVFGCCCWEHSMFMMKGFIATVLLLSVQRLMFQGHLIFRFCLIFYCCIELNAYRAWRFLLKQYFMLCVVFVYFNCSISFSFIWTVCVQSFFQGYVVSMLCVPCVMVQAFKKCKQLIHQELCM